MVESERMKQPTKTEKIKLSIDEKNLIQAEHIVKMEYDIANKEYRMELSKLQRFFKSDLCYTSFVKGYVAGLKAKDRGINMPFKDNKDETTDKN